MLNEWLEYRKEIKKPIKNEKTLKSLTEKFQSVSPKIIRQVVNNSIRNGYQGLFWDKFDGKEKLNDTNPEYDYSKYEGK